MNLKHCIDRLTANAEAFAALAHDVSAEQARWRPAPDKWSILEVVNHLYDEECEDFRARLDLLLHHPEQNWPSIAPQQWASERRYNERALDESLARFLAERRKSVAWLAGLVEPNWAARYERPQGSLSAGDLLASWVAHDFLHIRQLARLHWQYVGALALPHKTAYAGEW